MFGIGEVTKGIRTAGISKRSRGVVGRLFEIGVGIIDWG